MIILKRGNKGDLEIFEAPESALPELEKLKYKIFSPDDAGESYKEAIDIYKMEYEKCAQRYNDLYSSVWTNFSYMALVAGGLLTFGGARFVTPLTGFLACLPLLFWWVATFEPLNRYADEVEQRIVAIEAALTALSPSKLKDVPETVKKGLQHFTEFAKRGETKGSRPARVVQFVIVYSAILLAFLFALNTFLNISAPVLVAGLIGLMAAVVIIGSVEIIFQKTVRQDLGLVLQESGRVRFRVRVAAAVLLITAACFGIRVWQLKGQGLTVPPSKAAEH